MKKVPSQKVYKGIQRRCKNIATMIHFAAFDKLYDKLAQKKGRKKKLIS